MTLASKSTHQSVKHPQHSHSSKPTISTSASSTDPTCHGGPAWTVSALQKLSGLFSSPRGPSSPSAGNKKRGLVEMPGTTPPPAVTTVSDVIRDDDDASITDNSAARLRRSGMELEQVFRYLDENGDGKISPSELRSCIRALGAELSAGEAEAAVESTDSDGDGLLGFDDFVKLVDAEGEEQRTRDLREAFGMYEMKGKGCITPKSLRRMLRRIGMPRTREECKIMIRRFDLNSDGVLSFDEFKLMML